jgi:tetratricopeptide (TPR) repeat protein
MTGCLIVFFFCLAAGGQTKSAQDLYKAAVTADEQGNTPEAISLYRQTITIDPSAVQARNNLGIDLARAGNYGDAIAQYHAALKIDPRNQSVRLNLAIAHYQQADFEIAATELADLHKEMSDDAQVIDLLADCYLRLDRYAATIALLDPVYRSDPNDQAVQYALGTALIRSGKLQRGEEIINHILKNGNSAEANFLLGEAQFEAGDYKLAAETIRKAIDLKPNLPGLWSLYGNVLLRVNDPGAEAAFRHALQDDPNDYSANLHLGGLLRFVGKFADAAPYLEKALLLRPAAPEARLQVGALQAAEGKVGEARKTLELLEKDWPDFLETHLQLASLYARMNLKDQSERERQIVLKLNEKAREQGPQAPH